MPAEALSPVVPWIEVNQGIISVAALAAALAIALFEYLRANAVEEGRDTAFRAAVLGLLDNLTTKASDGIAMITAATARLDGNGGFRIWRSEADRTYSAFVALRPSAPPNPNMLLLLVEIEAELNPTSGSPHIFDRDEAKNALESRRLNCIALRGRFAALPR